MDSKAKVKTTITLTYGEQSENHVGMEINGDGLAESGFTISELETAKKNFEKLGCVCEIIHLDKVFDDVEGIKPAAILIARKGVTTLLKQEQSSIEKTSDDMFNELMSFDWDKKYYDRRRKKVLNKLARYNLCFGEEAQEPNYEQKKGRIVSFEQAKLTKVIKEKLEGIFGEKAKNTQVEGNQYYNVAKCGIGFHGDGERKRVIGVRLGACMPLHYQWFHKSQPIGETVKLTIYGGDIYAMSEKASGFDWKKRNTKTLRHAAGCSKYLKLKKKVKT